MHDSSPLVSVITPTLDARRYLGAMLESLGSQTYSNMEFVFMDGGSTDGTLRMIQEFSASHNVVLETAPDTGAYDALNKGIRRATGDILVMLSADNMLFPWSVQTAADIMVNDPTIQVAHGDMLVIDHQRNDVKTPDCIPR